MMRRRRITSSKIDETSARCSCPLKARNAVRAIKARPLPTSRPWISPFHGLSATYKIQTHTHLIDLEPDLQEGRAASSEPKSQPSRFAEGSCPLGMVLSACPDIVDYAKGGIS